MWQPTCVGAPVAPYSLAPHGSPQGLDRTPGGDSSNCPSPSSDRERSLGRFRPAGPASRVVATGLTLRIRRMDPTALEDRAARLEAERALRVRLAAAVGRSRDARERGDIVGLNLSVTVGR